MIVSRLVENLLNSWNWKFYKFSKSLKNSSYRIRTSFLLVIRFPFLFLLGCNFYVVWFLSVKNSRSSICWYSKRLFLIFDSFTTSLFLDLYASFEAGIVICMLCRFIFLKNSLVVFHPSFAVSKVTDCFHSFCMQVLTKGYNPLN